MGTFSKYSDIELQELVRKGLTQAEIARQLGVTPGSVCTRLKRLNVATCKDLTLVRVGEVLKRELDSADQLRKINNSVHKVLEEAEAAQLLNARQLREVVSCVEKYLPEDEEDAKDARHALETLYKLALDACPKDLVIKASGEIRRQLALQLQIFEAMYNMTAVREFQQEVLHIIGSVAPDARAAIIRKLAERSAIRSSLELSQ